jgi:plastocyanin domain-containing protein
MKHKINVQVILGGLVLASTLATSADGFQLSGQAGGCCGSAPTSGKHLVAQESKGVQKATVLVQDGKYTPSTIEVKKGTPVQITFKGGKKMGCGATIEFKSLKQTKTVKEGKTVAFSFTPSSAGEVKFACSMDMIRGKVVVK